MLDTITISLKVINRLEPMVSEHPGGYLEILEFLRDNPDIPVKYRKSWVEYVEEKDENEELVMRSKIMHEDGEVRTGLILSELLELIEQNLGQSTGTIANLIHRTLLIYGLPVPGTADWRKETETWFRSA